MKIKQIFAVLAVSASLMSCNFLDEFDPNATTAGNFYTSEADIETSLNGVYQSLAQSYYYQYNYYFTDVRAHVTVVTDSGASSGIPYQFYNYTLTEENQYVYNRYTQLFKSISRVNTLLSSMPQMGVKGEDLFNIVGTPPNLFAEIRGDAFAPRNPQALKIDFVKRPPYFKVTPTHKAKTWLLDPRAPKIEPPAAVKMLREEGL